MCLVYGHRVVKPRHQSHRLGYRTVRGDRGGRFGPPVPGQRPHGVANPIAPVDVHVVQRDRVRLVVRAAGQQLPGAAVQVAALDAVVHATLLLVAPVQHAEFHVDRDSQRLE